MDLKILNFSFLTTLCATINFQQTELRFETEQQNLLAGHGKHLSRKLEWKNSQVINDDIANCSSPVFILCLQISIQLPHYSSRGIGPADRRTKYVIFLGYKSETHYRLEQPKEILQNIFFSKQISESRLIVKFFVLCLLENVLGKF
jgi:hypothetical protein